MLICPHCKSENLIQNENEIICPTCNVKFPIIEGIPCFSFDEINNNTYFTKHLFPHLEGASDRHFWYLGRRLIIYNMIKNFSHKEMKMLEIGCGIGDVTKYLYRKDIDIETSDIYLNVLKMLKGKLGIKCYQLDAENIPFKEEYDIIGIFDVLEHIDNDNKVLKDINYALRKSGRVIITVPAFKFLWSYCDNVSCHKKRYVKKMLKKKLEENGFQIERISYMFFFISPLIMVSRIIGKFFVKKEKQQAMVENELKIIPIINNVFYYLMKIEAYIVKYLNLPFGTSLIAVARKV